MSSPQQVVIIGAGGLAREILDVFDAINAVRPTYDVLGFLVDAEYGTPGTLVNNKPILGDFDWLDGRSDQVRAVCAVGAPEYRWQFVQRLSRYGVRFCTVIHPNAVLTRWIEIGEGTMITAGCILTNQIKIGSHVLLNLDCTIGHDVVIDDYSTLSPGVHVSGKVVVEPGCYVGTGANVIEKKRLGAWSIVGAGSTIVKDVPPNTTVVGVPGQVVKTRPEGWHQGKS